MRNWIAKDFSWKMFSLFLALVIWLTVHKIYEEPGATTARTRDIIYGDLPVLVVSESADVHDFRVVPATVSVTVSGSPEAMSTLQADEIHATVDITTGKELRQKVEVAAPPGVKLVSIDPPRVTVVVPAPAKIKSP
jgi:YbbR domain-containing protein